jgi:AraC-like DNA-binding protein
MAARRYFLLDRPALLDERASSPQTGLVRGDELWSDADPLGAALHLLRMSGTFYFRSELSAPWGLGIPPMPDCLWFHVVTAGEALLEVDDDAAARPLRPGELALVPHGSGHRLRSDPDAAAPSVLDVPHDFVTGRYAIIRHGGGGPATTLVCGAVRFDHPAARSLIDVLPATIHLAGSGADPDTEWVQATLRMMAAEAARLRPGGETVLTRLSDVLVIQAIRAWLETDPAGHTGWLGALRDRQIGRALALVHRDPARDWTVAALAAETAMSRSAFAARFTELVGEPAMQYVTRWRMHIALHELGTGSATVAQLAGRLGYRSEAAFSRAFKRVVGIAPGAARQRAAALG